MDDPYLWIRAKFRLGLVHASIGRPVAFVASVGMLGPGLGLGWLPMMACGGPGAALFLDWMIAISLGFSVLVAAGRLGRRELGAIRFARRVGRLCFADSIVYAAGTVILLVTAINSGDPRSTALPLTAILVIAGPSVWLAADIRRKLRPFPDWR